MHPRAELFLTAAVLVAGHVEAVAGEDLGKKSPESIEVSTVTVVDIGTGGLEIDADGSLYIADFGAILGDPATAGTKVLKLTPDKKVDVFAEGFKGASGNALDSQGNFYQSNIQGGSITRITPDGEMIVFARGLKAPVGIVIDDDDTLFVANCGSASIQRITREGESSRFAASRLLVCPNGLAMDESKNLYVANFSNGDVIKITGEGELSKLATLPGNNNGHLAYFGGDLYVVARSAHQIYRVSLEGEVHLLAGSGKKGGKDGLAEEASFCYPNDIVISPDGKTLYINDVADESSQGRKLGPTRVRRISLGG